MSVKKIKYSRTEVGRERNKHPCACMRVYGMKRCVAEYDAAKDMMYYRGIPCEHCKTPINKWENEFTVCDECWNAEIAVSERNLWYAETVYGTEISTPMHQEVKEYVDIDKWLEEQMREILGDNPQ